MQFNVYINIESSIAVTHGVGEWLTKKNSFILDNNPKCLFWGTDTHLSLTKQNGKQKKRLLSCKYSRKRHFSDRWMRQFSHNYKLHLETDLAGSRISWIYKSGNHLEFSSTKLAIRFALYVDLLLPFPPNFHFQSLPFLSKKNHDFFYISNIFSIYSKAFVQFFPSMISTFLPQF